MYCKCEISKTATPLQYRDWVRKDQLASFGRLLDDISAGLLREAAQKGAVVVIVRSVIITTSKSITITLSEASTITVIPKRKNNETCDEDSRSGKYKRILHSSTNNHARGVIM